MQPVRFLAAVSLAMVAGAAPSAIAMPTGPQAFCLHYPDAPACAAGPIPCVACHTVAPARNPYGEQIAAVLAPGEPRPLSSIRFGEALPAALDAVADDDADLDGFTNADEIRGGSDPADATSQPVSGDCIDADPHDGYDVCAYDPGFALRRIYYDVCGHAPPRGTVQDIQARHASGGSVFPDLHAALDECLMTEAWRGRDGRVWRMGHERIRPLKAISSKPSDPGPIQLADYDADFALFVYAQIGDHDARDMLLFTDFVRAQTVDGQTTYEPYEVGTVTETLLSIFFGQTEVGDAQFVSPEYRAGLLTHRWFLMLNTMFSSVPRTSAAQAYRAYLGYDLAKLEGLAPVDGEPVDYDAKGVAEPECSVCHSTLDPLAYPFSRYEGIGGGINGPEDQCDGVPGVRLPFVYNDDRMDAFVEVDGDRVADTPESGVLFGQPVADLREWAEVAANSDAFADQLVTMWWTELVGRAPRPDEGEIVRALSDELRFVHGYSVERMLHDLVLTEAYGAP